MCIMETISIGSVVISESPNGHLRAHPRQGNTSKCGGLTCLSLLKARSPARILSGKYLSEQQARQNMAAALRVHISTWQPAAQPPQQDYAQARLGSIGIMLIMQTDPGKRQPT